MSRPVFGFVPAAPFIAPALPVAVPAVTGAAVAGVGLAASLPVLVAVGAGLAGGFLLGAGLAQLSDQFDAAQTWGLFNSRAKRSVFLPPTPGAAPATGTVPPPGNTTGATLKLTVGVESYSRVQTPGCNFPVTVTNAINFTYTLNNVVEVTGPFGDSKQCGFSQLYYLVRFANGSTQKWGPGAGSGVAITSWSAGYGFEWLNAAAVPFPNPTFDATPPDYVFPQLVGDDFRLVSSSGDSQAALPTPAQLGVFALGDQLTEQETGNAAAPALPPLIAPTFWPALAPAGRPIAADGNLVPLPPALPATTPADVHFPVAGGSPVGGLAQSPPATLAGIAAEVGRIEAKLNRLLNPLAPGDSTDLLQLLWQAIQALYNSMVDNRPAGEYLLSTPCELDDYGDRIVSSVGYPETSDNTAAVLARIDALAALLQTHKDLKQPICRQTPAVGQPVQVQFVQIE